MQEIVDLLGRPQIALLCNSFSEIRQPTISVTGKPLPPARTLSVELFPDVKIDDNRFTLATMQWGQLITHDMSLASGSTLAGA